MSRLIRRALPGARPPFELLAALDAGGAACALDAAAPGGWGTDPGGAGPGRSLLALEPEVEFRGALDAVGDALRWLAPHSGRAAGEAFLIGALSYDLGRAFERVPDIAHDDGAGPVAWLAGFRAAYVWDRARREGWLEGSDARALDRLAARLEPALRAPTRRTVPILSPPCAAAPDRDFLAGVRRVQEWIRAGDVYQVNLSRRLDWRPFDPADAAPLYRSLTARAPAPFAACLAARDFALISNSPERFLRVCGPRVETAPIKGTRPRGETPERDAWLAKELSSSEKDRAEHVMIVDLERNDLGRVCRTGSVRVARLAALRSFATVHHLVSSVQGDLRDGAGALDLLRATFPGGSITGAPKVRAMEIIESLEPLRRGHYTGAFGQLDAGGGIDLALGIRTAVAARGRLQLQLGAGIVADSEPEAELGETRDKGRAFAALLGEPA